VTKPKYVPGPDTSGVSAEELVKLRAKARAYLKDEKGLRKLAKDLQEDVVTVLLIDRLLATETWRASERVSADSRGRFAKMAETVADDIEKNAGVEDELDGVIE
jgi:hypothetical protein